MKRIINHKLALFPLIFTFILSGLNALAENYSDVVLSLQIDNPIMTVNGTNTEIDSNNTTPVVIDGRTLVPVRAIIESFGGNVGWNSASRTVTLSLDNNEIDMMIENNTAYINDLPYTLDVAPTVINDRTMLPIRFIAEGFNLGVAWNSDTQRVYIIKNTFDEKEYTTLMSLVPPYSSLPYATINDNTPFFESYEIIDAPFEYYSTLDSLGRCNVCLSSVSTALMPTDKRGDISSVTPTGWINVSYDEVPGGYLYNRCHLIGHQLTGENANVKNLITGTRYLNMEGMLPFENEIADYIESTRNHVMYRVTPVFTNNNLVADGVLLEAYSVEDNGTGISFCVYCYNVQPYIEIDYSTGTSRMVNTTPDVNNPVSDYGVYRTPSGKRYHFDPDCGGKNSYETTMTDAVNAGLSPCSKCAN